MEVSNYRSPPSVTVVKSRLGFEARVHKKTPGRIHNSATANGAAWNLCYTTPDGRINCTASKNRIQHGKDIPRRLIIQLIVGYFVTYIHLRLEVGSVAVGVRRYK